MCWAKNMEDILPKEKPAAINVSWYLEDLLLSYKYSMRSRFERDLNAIKPYLSNVVYNCLVNILENNMLIH